MPKPLGTGRPYTVICVSVYLDELKKWDALVERLKAEGQTHVTRSGLLRHAMSKLGYDVVVPKNETGRES